MQSKIEAEREGAIGGWCSRKNSSAGQTAHHRIWWRAGQGAKQCGEHGKGQNRVKSRSSGRAAWTKGHGMRAK